MLIDLRQSVLGVFRDPTLKKVLIPSQNLSDIGPVFPFKTFFGVGSLEIQGSNPEESLGFTFQVKTSLT